MNHEIDVLVSTTIIETGLDIPNVNTMIIHDANQAWVVPVVSVKRTCRKIESKCICIFDVQKKHTVKRNRRKTITGNPGIYRSGIRL